MSNRWSSLIIVVLLLIGAMLLPEIALANEERVVAIERGLSGEGVSQPVVLILVLLGLALLPLLGMMTTAFVKLVVIISMIRNALGTQQVPPTTVVTGLAFVLTLYVMTPVGIEIFQTAEATIKKDTEKPLLSQASVNTLIESIDKGKEPMRKFLDRHSHEQEKKLFYSLAKKMSASHEKASKVKLNTDVAMTDFRVLIPAFVISELTEAFQIAFIVFLPFLIIDVVVTNILLALGMFMVPPVTIALPFKLLLFVMVDGWHILTRALLAGYM